MKQLLVLAVVTLGLTLMPVRSMAQGGISLTSTADMNTPADGDPYYSHWDPIPVATANHLVKIHVNPNQTIHNVGWDMWVEIDGSAHDADSANAQDEVTDGMGWWIHTAHGIGVCQYTIPSNTYPAGEPVAHYANPWAELWLGVLTSTPDSTPSRRFDVGS